MADINHVISLGIGSPAAIPQFLLLGLSLGAVIDPTPDTIVAVRPDVGTIRIRPDVGTVEL